MPFAEVHFLDGELTREAHGTARLRRDDYGTQNNKCSTDFYQACINAAGDFKRLKHLRVSLNMRTGPVSLALTEDGPAPFMELAGNKDQEGQCQ